MSKTEEMIEKAKKLTSTHEQREEQRRSFAYGNAKTENDRVTRTMVDNAALKHPRD